MNKKQKNRTELHFKNQADTFLVHDGHATGSLTPGAIDDAVAKYPDREHRCPMCGGDDVDIGTNRTMTASASTTVLCNGCQYTESGIDADALYLKWTRPVGNR